MQGFSQRALRALAWAPQMIADLWTRWLVIRELRRLNDHLLRDIGVARPDIEAFVDAALAERRAERIRLSARSDRYPLR